MRSFTLILASLLCLLLAAPGSAQVTLVETRVVAPEVADPRGAESQVAERGGVESQAALARAVNLLEADSTTRSLTWTLLGATVGTLAGGWLGYEIDHARNVPSENPGLFGMLGGALVGSTVGSALGAHSASDGEGSFGRRILVSSAIAAIGAGLIAVTEDGVQTGFAIAVPVGQIVALGF